MDKIKQYKNLNEQVSKLLRKTAPTDINEEVAVAAQELVETLEDPAKLAVLMRTGLVQANHISRVRNALKDPDKAMKNASIRYDLMNMLMTLINVVTANPSAFASVRKGVKGATALAAEGEMTESKAGGIYDDSDDEDDTTRKGGKPRKGGKISKGGVYDHVPQGTMKGRLGKGRPAGAGASGFSEVYSRICEKAKMNIDEMDEMDENDDEVLSPKQKQLDVNKNNKIDAEDLRTLRSRKQTKVDEMYSHITEAKIQSEKAFAKKWLSSLKKTDMDGETTSKFGTLGATLSNMVKVFGKPHTNNKYTIDWVYESKMKDGSKIKFNIYQDKKDDSYDKNYWSFGSMDSPGNDHHYEIGEYLSQFLMDIDFAH